MVIRCRKHDNLIEIEDATAGYIHSGLDLQREIVESEKERNKIRWRKKKRERETWLEGLPEAISANSQLFFTSHIFIVS